MTSCYESSYETEIAFRDSFKDMYDMEEYLIGDELIHMRQSLRRGYTGIFEYDMEDAMMYELFGEYVQIRINEFEKWFEY